MLNRGANVNAQTEETGETALTLAACGAFMYEFHHFFTPQRVVFFYLLTLVIVLISCNGVFSDVVRLLVERGADLSLGANTPLMEAAQEGHLETVNYVLSEYRRQNGRYVRWKFCSDIVSYQLLLNFLFNCFAAPRKF